MTYSDVITYLYSQLPMFHRVGQSAYKANLDNALYLDRYFGHPHRKYKTVHIAGTNGKGSTSHMLASILQEAGYKTGLFTSPHLKDFRERIRVNGQMIGEDYVVRFIEAHKPVFDDIKPSFFEMTSALAFQYFADENVDIAVIEVGLGGRLDSTNIINPLLSVITNIGLDHTDILGDSLAKIAAQKAGIIKERTPVVIGEFNEDTWPVFEEKSRSLNIVPILAENEYRADYSLFTTDQKQVLQVTRQGETIYKDLKLDLSGFYQRKNTCTVLAATDALKQAGINISREAIYAGCTHVMQNTGLQGRWQILGNNPLIICDTGHNKDGIREVVNQIQAVACKKLHMVIGFVKDKDISAIIKQMPKNAKYYFTQANIPRALPANELQGLASSYGLSGSAYSQVNEALEAAKNNASKDDFIFVGGSTFVVAEVI